MKKVLLMIDISRASGRQYLRGIERYIHTHQGWEIFIQPPNFVSKGDMVLNKWIEQRYFNGFIVRDSPYLQSVLNLDIPKVVFESKHEAYSGITFITSDCQGISKMAADYFIGLGFRNFAYCGFDNLPWSRDRLKAYKAIICSNKNFKFFKYDGQHGMDDTISERENIASWLEKLPRPLCVFTCNDERAVYVLEVCKIVGLKVPEEIAILGVDNDELICNLSSPPLSSIKVGFEKAGYEAAEILDEQMNGNKTVTNITITAKAQYLVTRRSSDVIAVNDEDVIKAIRYIRENYKKPIQVVDVVEITSYSRRTLEQRFKKYLKRSINNEINRLRIEDVKWKLANSNIPIYKIVSSLGYVDSDHFSRFFKKMTSYTPKEYRHLYGHIDIT